MSNTRTRKLAPNEKLFFGEVNYFLNLLKVYPTGLLSVVSDTWNLWEVCTKILPMIKSEVLARDGKLVIRPDSGDPADILCGTVPAMDESEHIFFDNDDLAGYEGELKALLEENGGEYAILFAKNTDTGVVYQYEMEQGDFIESPDVYENRVYDIKEVEYTPAEKGVVELLWDVFGGTVNEQGFKVLDSHIGAIYGDSITLERAKNIMQRLADKGFAYSNVVLGVGSYTYQYNTRDTFGFAIKATYGEVSKPKPGGFQRTVKNDQGIVVDFQQEVMTEGREIFKDPITDDGTKKSAKGLLRVDKDKDGKYVLRDRQTWDQEKGGELETVFLDGKLVKTQTLAEIRARVIENTPV
jgi:nicotinamide phosphoribosyltransferase